MRAKNKTIRQARQQFSRKKMGCIDQCFVRVYVGQKKKKEEKPAHRTFLLSHIFYFPPPPFLSVQ